MKRDIDAIIGNWQELDFHATFDEVTVEGDVKLLVDEIKRLRARLAAADRLAASVRRLKVYVIEHGIGPDPLETEVFEMEAAYIKMKGGE